MTAASDKAIQIGRDELEAATSAGILDREVVDRLLVFVTKTRAHPESGRADEEQFRLISGFNDIFVTIGIGLFLGALAYLFGRRNMAEGSLAVAAASWALAEFFTRHRRMAFPSIVLVASFTVSVFAAVFSVIGESYGRPYPEDTTGLTFLTAGAATFLAGSLHWIRFRVPVTVAAITAAALASIGGIIESIWPGILSAHPVAFILPMGLATFALAMRFDISDRDRVTRRTDIAFWLHILAAPIVVHPVVWQFRAGDEVYPGAPLPIIALFALLGAVALIVDRRALLVSSLSYLAVAVFQLFSQTGLTSESGGFAVLVVGTIILALSAAWQFLRAVALKFVPDSVRALLPPATRCSPRTAA